MGKADVQAQRGQRNVEDEGAGPVGGERSGGEKENDR